VKELPAVKNMTAREARGALFNVSGKHADALRKMLFYVEDQDLELPDLVQHCVDDVLHSGVYRFSPTQLLDCLFRWLAVSVEFNSLQSILMFIIEKHVRGLKND